LRANLIDSRKNYYETKTLLSVCSRNHAAGLVLGKPLGIVTFSALAVKLGWARLLEGVNWKVLTGAGCLAGIGFTMSLFIAGLALDDELLRSGKIGALAGSALSATIGCTLLWWFLRKERKGP